MDESEFPQVASKKSRSAGLTELPPGTQRLPNKLDPLISAISKGWLGILIAGGLYPVVVAFLTAIRLTIEMGGLPPTAIGIILMMTIFGTVTGFVVAGLWSGVAIGTFTLVSWSFGHAFRPRAAVGVCGGLTGFLATMFPFGFPPPGFVLPPPFMSMMFTVGLIALAMTMGQVGALRFASSGGAFNLPINKQITGHQFQFNIRHLLTATVWIGLVLALDQAIGEYILISLLGLYAALQTLLLAADKFIQRMRQPAPIRPRQST